MNAPPVQLLLLAGSARTGALKDATTAQAVAAVLRALLRVARALWGT